ncbi:MAG: hypothetical protein KTR31_32375 [Myxococcales bacterium]|nr:hypothetical protein [Myxococcales bacterium]
MILSVLLSVAWSNPVERGLQAQIHPHGYQFVADQVTGTQWDFGPTDLLFEPKDGCYHEVQINGFNLSVGLGQVTLLADWQGMDMNVEVTSARGEDMNLVGDTDFFDLCPDVDLDVKFIELSNGRIQGELAADVQAGAVDLYFPQAMTVTGDISSEIAWVPDDLVWSLASEQVLEALAGVAEEELPKFVGELTSEGFLFSAFGDFEVEVTAEEVLTSPEGLYVATNVDVGGLGGVATTLDLEPRAASHLAIGLTDVLAEDVMGTAWAEGILSSDSEELRDLVVSLLASLGLEDDVDVSLTLAESPEVQMVPDGILMQLGGTTLVAESEGESLLELVGDVEGWLEVRLQGGAITLTAHELFLTVTEIDAGRLVDRDPENLRQFLEGWVIEAATVALGELEIYQSHFEALGYVLRIDQSEFQVGGLAAWCTLFDADDPAVDRDAPDTSLTLEVNDDSTVRATFTGLDDREGELFYSWRIDEGSWSRWSPVRAVDIEVGPGDHLIEVMARDLWHNEDPTPAQGSVSIAEEPEDVEKKGCGCASTGMPASAALLLLGGIVGVRRRRSA